MGRGVSGHGSTLSMHSPRDRAIPVSTGALESDQEAIDCSLELESETAAILGIAFVLK